MPGLPTQREETVVAGGLIKANVINAIQDVIVGHKKPPITKLFFPRFVNSPGNWSPPSSVQQHWLSQAAAVAALITIPMEAGDRVTSLKFSANGDGFVDCTYTVWWLDASQAATQIATLADNNRPIGWGIADITPFTAHVFAAGESLLIQVAPNAGGYRLGNGQLVYDRL